MVRYQPVENPYEEKDYRGFGTAAKWAGAGVLGMYGIKKYTGDKQMRMLYKMANKYPSFYQHIRNRANIKTQRLGSGSPFDDFKYTMDDYFSPFKTGWFKSKLKEDFGLFRPYRTRAVNDTDRVFHSLFPKESAAKRAAILDRGKIGKVSGASLFGLYTIKAALEESGHPSALASGIVAEVGSQIGSRAGIAVGSMIGARMGGAAFGMAAGGIGMVAGGIAGYMGLNLLKGLSSMGRRWSNPELGGSFRDSMESQTMRQRSLLAIRTSRFNLRSELGNEAFRLVNGYSPY